MSVQEVVDDSNFIVSLTIKKKALIRNNLSWDLDLLHIEGISPSVLTLAQGITNAFSLCGYVPTSPLGCCPVLVRHECSGKIHILKCKGTSLVVQWLTLQAPNAGGWGSIPGQRTRSHMPQLSVCML